MHAKTKSRKADPEEGVGGPTLKSGWAAKYLFFWMNSLNSNIVSTIANILFWKPWKKWKIDLFQRIRSFPVRP